MTPQVLVIGGGMITHDQILPSLFQLQRLGIIGELSVCAQHARSIRKLASSQIMAEAFPGQTFHGYPESGEERQPERYKAVLAKLPPRNIVFVAVPDQLHFDIVMEALCCNQHVCCVKPLVLKASEALAIEQEARKRGLMVAVEYHKRFDDRSLMARQRYRQGLFGEFRLGSATLMEKWFYRESNFQNWCTTESSDAFSYIGCHYVDLVHFITGLLPASVSCYGIVDQYPNGQEGYLWADARVLWENGACLNVQTSLSYPDAAPGSNAQGLVMHCSGSGAGGLIEHSDQYRGVQYCYAEPPQYSEPSPDYFQYVHLGGKGLQPVGYGYRSVEFIVKKCMEAESADDKERFLQMLDDQAIIATPANSRFNELVMEAGRLSLLNDAREVLIEYGAAPGVKLRT